MIMNQETTISQPLAKVREMMDELRKHCEENGLCVLAFVTDGEQFSVGAHGKAVELACMMAYAASEDEDFRKLFAAVEDLTEAYLSEAAESECHPN